MAKGRRLGLQAPQLVGRDPETYNFELQRFLEALLDGDDDGIPAGFNDVDPTTIEAGVEADPGVENTGWAAADHTHAVATEAPVPIGKVLAEGTRAYLARSDHVHTNPLAFSDVDNGDSPYTPLITDDVLIIDASGGPVTVALTAASLNLGRRLTVKKVDSSLNAVTVDADGAETIDGDPDFALLYEDESIEIACDGVEWWIL
jgi:hypothetical protein